MIIDNQYKREMSVCETSNAGSSIYSSESDDDLLKTILKRHKLTMIYDKLIDNNVDIERLWELSEKQLELLGLNVFERSCYWSAKNNVKQHDPSGRFALDRISNDDKNYQNLNNKKRST